ENARALVMGQAAEKVYRSLGPDTLFNSNLIVKDQAFLEWLPQETIVFDQSRLHRTTRIDIADTGQFTGAEMLVFGRTAMGERLHTGLVRDVWDIRQNGKRLWADALHLDGDITAKLDHPAGFDGARAVATFIHVSPDAEKHLEFARSLLDQDGDVRTGVTMTNSVLVARWLAKDTLKLRSSFGNFWATFRAHTQNLPGRMPRLWHV
ncbi:MAG: urease accessory protein UreD, partial [Sneathiellales bacterium]|nr:urease accessory protein UreD [Sneathiellales bacterium]